MSITMETKWKKGDEHLVDDAGFIRVRLVRERKDGVSEYIPMALNPKLRKTKQFTPEDCLSYLAQEDWSDAENEFAIRTATSVVFLTQRLKFKKMDKEAHTIVIFIKCAKHEGGQHDTKVAILTNENAVKCGRNAA